MLTASEEEVAIVAKFRVIASVERSCDVYCRFLHRRPSCHGDHNNVDARQHYTLGFHCSCYTANSRLYGVCAPFFLARCDVRGVSELICVELFFWILKPFLAVSRYARTEAKADQDSTAREYKGETA